MLGSTACARLPRKLTKASPDNSACVRNNTNAPKGLARRQLKPTRSERGNDSGRTN